MGPCAAARPIRPARMILWNRPLPLIPLVPLIRLVPLSRLTPPGRLVPPIRLVPQIRPIRPTCQIGRA